MVESLDRYKYKDGHRFNEALLSTNPVLFGEALLFDFSNHLSALLLSPESSLPIRGFKLEGEPEPTVEEG